MKLPASFKNILPSPPPAASAKAGEGIREADFPIFTLTPAYRQADVE